MRIQSAARAARWSTPLLWLACTCTNAVLAQTSVAMPTAPAVLEAEPPALRRLLQQASTLEAAPNTPDGAWQAAVLYCQSARWGSTEAQYRLGMLYAFGQGVPQSQSFAAALFALAASLGHAQAGQMLDNIELNSIELPACVNQEQLPEKAATAVADEWAAELAAAGPSIDQFLLSLPAHKRWLIALTTKLSAWYALDPKLVLSVIAVESNFETGARSPKAAMGLMQLIPDTAERFNVRNAFDATQSLRGGMRYLRWLLSYYRGNIRYALAAYNAGEGRVDRYRGVPPFTETRAYVKRVIGLYGNLHHGFDERLALAPTWLATDAR